MGPVRFVLLITRDGACRLFQYRCLSSSARFTPPLWPPSRREFLLVSGCAALHRSSAADHCRRNERTRGRRTNSSLQQPDSRTSYPGRIGARGARIVDLAAQGIGGSRTRSQLIYQADYWRKIPITLKSRRPARHLPNRPQVQQHCQSRRLVILTFRLARPARMPAHLGYVPVPPTPACCGLGLASSKTCKSAERAPVCVGVKVTWIVQCAPTARLLGQLLV